MIAELDLRDLEYIIAVADMGHFGRAANRCFVSQPTLSGQIKKLEEELGITIFERTNRSVVTTPVGEAILVYARQMVEQSQAIRQLALAHQGPLAGPLRIGVIPTLSPYLMPLILVPLKKQHPDLNLVLSEEMTDVLRRGLGQEVQRQLVDVLTEILVARLLNHEIDAAILATSVAEQDLVSTALFDEPFWVAYSLDHPFYLKQKINKKDLKKENLLTLAEGHCLADQTRELCDIDRNQPGNKMADLRASSLETLIQFVGAGFGITLVPALALRGSWSSGSGVAVQALAMAGARRRVSIVTRPSFPRNEAIKVLAETIRNHLPNTVHPVI